MSAKVDNILDNLNVTQVESFKDLKELKKWLINEKGKEHDIRMIAFDVVEELIPLAEAEVIRMSKESHAQLLTAVSVATESQERNFKSC